MSFFTFNRFNIAGDLIEEATGAGELGFAGILVWMRFMATRQLIWNKNYNVKPRYIFLISTTLCTSFILELRFLSSIIMPTY